MPAALATGSRFSSASGSAGPGAAAAASRPNRSARVPARVSGPVPALAAATGASRLVRARS